MKEVGTASWNSPNADATNTSLFSALPGGYRDINGTYSEVGGNGRWWSSTDSGGNIATYRYMGYGSGNAASYGVSKKYGLSVRCLRD